MIRKLPSRFKIAVHSRADATEVLKAFETYGFLWRRSIPATEWYPHLHEHDVVGFHVDHGNITYSYEREYFNDCPEPQLQLCDLIQRNKSVAINSDTLSMF